MIKKIVLLGYGTIGKCVFDLLTLDNIYIRDTLGLDVQQMPIIVIDRYLPSTEEKARLSKRGRNIHWIEYALKKDTLKPLFESISLEQHDLVIDVTSCTETRLIVKLVAYFFKACYICTALEGWDGWIYPMPEMVSKVAQLKEVLPDDGRHPSVLVTHGMNPGMVSHFAIQAVKMIPENERKSISIMHITETDTQKVVNSAVNRRNLAVAVPKLIKRDSRITKDIISTWGPQNFVDEMNTNPYYVQKGRTTKDKKRSLLCPLDSFIYDPVTDGIVSYTGYNVTHEETFTLNNYLKSNIGAKANLAFIYKPSDISFKSLISSNRGNGNSKSRSKSKRKNSAARCNRKGLLLKGPDVRGYDTVGIYVQTQTGRKVWVGNACSAGYAPTDAIKERYHNATTMQVAAGVMSAIYVISKAPNLGFRYPEEIPDALRPGLLSFSERYYGKITIKTW